MTPEPNIYRGWTVLTSTATSVGCLLEIFKAPELIQELAWLAIVPKSMWGRLWAAKERKIHIVGPPQEPDYIQKYIYLFMNGGQADCLICSNNFNQSTTTATFPSLPVCLPAATLTCVLTQSPQWFYLNALLFLL